EPATGRGAAMKLQRALEQETVSCFPRSAIYVCSRSILFLLLFSATAVAHEVRPAYLELRQTGPETYDVLWKVPGRGENLRLGLYAELPSACTNTSRPQATMTNNAYTERWSATCPGGLTGGRILIVGLSATKTDVLVRIERLDGSSQ